MSQKQMHLALMLGGSGSHLGSWRMPGAEHGPDDFSIYRRSAELAEKAKFDLLFIADAPYAYLSATTGRNLEALTVLSALATCTTHIGLGGTVSTSFSEPYNVARMFASMDRISGGRAGWNVVTSSADDAAYNFGDTPHMPKAERYEKSAEFVQVVKGLWDSWEDDAVLNDKTNGKLYDESKVHALNHTGKYFSVKGPLDQARPPQGYPVIFQAGASEVGLPFAAQMGEVVFTVQESMEFTKGFRERIRSMAAENGRNPEHLLILPGLCPFVAETEEKAREMLWELSQYIDEKAAWALLSSRMGMDVTGMDPEGPLPKIPWDQMRGHAKTITSVAEKNGFNLRQARDYAAAAAGHRLVFGTPEMVADDLERWFRSGACDGFIIAPPVLMGSMEAFIEGVVPILQKRGVFRKEYEGTTLREHLGLPRPEHPLFTKREIVAAR
jgi:N-acetyl-S-(2-succino)cysteine monooxygenase